MKKNKTIHVKISCLIHRKDCLPPPVRLRSSYLKSLEHLPAIIALEKSKENNQ